MVARTLRWVAVGLVIAAASGPVARAHDEHADAHARQRLIAERVAADTQASPARAADGPVAPPAEVGSWSPAVALPVIAINAALLPTGKVLMFAYPARPGYDGYENVARAYVWDPASGTSKRVDPPVDPATAGPTNIWCAGTSFLADGRVLVTGGNVGDPLKDFHGLPTVFTFDPFTETWTQHPSMAQGRWYPSQTLMPDGRTLILAGLTAPGDRDYEVARTNTDVEVFSPDGSLARYDALRLGEAGTPQLPGLYPRTFWMRSGQLLMAGPQAQDTWMIEAPRPGAQTGWTEIPDLSTWREWGSAVMLPDGRVMTFGGSDADRDGDGVRPATHTTEVFDETDAPAGWKRGPNLAVERSHANSVLLPDGTVATVGGGFGEDGSAELFRWLFDPERHTRVELYDPATDRVTLGPRQSEGRTYHSVALLLPDGRVMSAGDDINGRPTAEHPDGAGTGTHDDTAELYSPPYLFRGPRPRISSAPATVAHGARFGVGTPDASVVRAVLVAPAAVTHAVDYNQRVVELAAPEAVPGKGVNLRAPASLDAAPPGHYMLFLLNARGVPSVARFVRLDPAAPAAAVLVPDPPVPDPTATASATAAPTPAPTPVPTVTPEAAPRLELFGRLPRLRTLRRTGVFTLNVRLSVPGTVTLAAALEKTGGTAPVAAVRRVTFTSAGERRVRFRLTRSGVRRLERARRAVIRVTARARRGASPAVVAVARRLAR